MFRDDFGEDDFSGFSIVLAAAWVGLPYLAFLIASSFADYHFGWVAAGLTVAVMSAFAFHRPGRSRFKQAMLSGLRWLLASALKVVFICGAFAAVVIGLFFNDEWRLVAIPAALAAVLFGAVLALDIWYARLGSGRTADADERHDATTDTVEAADALRAAQWRAADAEASKGFWGELLVGNAESKLAAVATTARRIQLFTVPPGVGANFVATRSGPLAEIKPLDAAAARWLRAFALDKTTMWTEDAAVVNLRDFPSIAEAIVEAGFRFQRGPYLS